MDSITISNLQPRAALHILQLARVFKDGGLPDDRIVWEDNVKSLVTLLEFMRDQLPEGHEGNKVYYDKVHTALEACLQALYDMRN